MAYADVWLQNFPWWGLWMVFTPIIFIAPRLIPFERTSLLYFAIKHLMFMTAVMLTYWATAMLLDNLIHHGSLNLIATLLSYSDIFFRNVQINILVYLAILFTRYCVIYYQGFKQQSIRNDKLTAQLLQVELESLRSQLNPHFLFNTLNTVTSLIRLKKSENAITALSELGLMLRRVLENQHNQMVTVEQEMEFIHSFLTIQKMRFGEKLDTHINVETDCLSLQLPFMILQPLVENAVQHGSQLQTDENLIRLDIFQEEANLKVKLINQMSEKNDHQGFGIGIKNCKQRMEMLYGDRFELVLKELEHNCFETSLSIPIGGYVD